MIRRAAVFLLCAALLGAAAPVARPSPNFTIRLSPGEMNLAQFKGKVVILALIMTGCPHCQNTTFFLSDIQKQYASRGVQVLAAAFNEDAPQMTPGFIQAIKPSFPVGYAKRSDVVSYLGKTESEELWVPALVFIDKKGVIRHQHLGNDAFFQNGDKNIRAYLEEMLK